MTGDVVAAAEQSCQETGKVGRRQFGQDFDSLLHDDLLGFNGDLDALLFLLLVELDLVVQVPAQDLQLILLIARQVGQFLLFVEAQRRNLPVLGNLSLLDLTFGGALGIGQLAFVGQAVLLLALN